MIAKWKTEELVEMNKLEKYLSEHGYEYVRHDRNPEMPENVEPISDFHQIIVMKDGERQLDAICHYGSWGYELGLLEIYGNIVHVDIDGDSAIGWQRAADIIERLENGGYNP